jgi:hypothetical protein
MFYRLKLYGRYCVVIRWYVVLFSITYNSFENNFQIISIVALFNRIYLSENILMWSWVWNVSIVKKTDVSTEMSSANEFDMIPFMVSLK